MKGAEFGARMVERYRLGLNDESKKLARLGVAESEEKQVEGRLGECAVALRLGLDPHKVLNWENGADDGGDLMFFGVCLDVKATGWNGRLLQWLPTKDFDSDRNRFHVLVLVRGFGIEWEVCGWIEKEAFRARKRVSIGPSADKLLAGSWFVDRRELWPMSDFDARYPVQALARRAGLLAEYVKGEWP